MNKIIPCISFVFASFAGFAQQTLLKQTNTLLYEQGVTLMAQENYGGARSVFEQYLTTPDQKYEKEATYNNAICALKLYHLDGEKLMDHFLKYYPHTSDSHMAHYELGIYFFRDRNYAEAINHLNKISMDVLTRKQVEEATYKLAYSYFAKKQFNNAINPFNKIKSGSSSYANLSSYYAGFIEFQNDDFDEALNDYQSIAGDEAFRSEIPYMISSVYYRKGDFQLLIDYARPLIDQEEGIQQKNLLLLLLAESYFSIENYSKAAHYYSLSYKKQKFTPEAIYHYGFALKEIGKYDQATDLLKIVASLKTNTGTLASYLLGELYLQLDNKPFALAAFIKVAKSENMELSEEAMFLSGKISFDLDRTTESINQFKSYVNKFPQGNHIQEANELLSQAYLYTNNYRLAIDYIEKLANRSTRILEAYQKATFLYGVDYYNKRNFKQAVQFFEKSLLNKYSEIYTLKAHYWLGEAYSIGRRFEEAIPHYKSVLAADLPKEDLSALASYGLAYCEYNLARYNSARAYFARFINETPSTNSRYGDALVRLADCYYVTKDYSQALGNYQKAISSVVRQKDYAYYQSGVIYGIIGNESKAFANLRRVIAIYQSSPYVDDALFEIASLQLEAGGFSRSIDVFTRLINEKPRSRYVSYGLERRAVAYFNLQQYEKTINDYQSFLEKYPDHPDVENVLLGLQDAYSLINQPGLFNTVLADFKTRHPEIKGLQNIEYESIKSLYNNQNYKESAVGFQAFLDQYPEDLMAFEAKYLLAESLFRLNLPDTALSTYYSIFQERQYEQLSRVVERIADLEYTNHHYEIAGTFYNELKGNALNNNQKYRAWTGLMRTHYSIGNYDSVQYYADQLINLGSSQKDYMVTATLYLGRAFLSKGMFNEALLQFERTTQLTQDENGAEAQYYIGVVLHEQGDFQNSNEALYQIPSLYGSYSEWLDKAFLLIADNFISMKEYFQAKATLQSIIDNSVSESTISSARNRFSRVSALEQIEQKFILDSIANDESDTTGND